MSFPSGFQVCPSTAAWRRTARMWPTSTRSVSSFPSTASIREGSAINPAPGAAAFGGRTGFSINIYRVITWMTAFICFPQSGFICGELPRAWLVWHMMLSILAHAVTWMWGFTGEGEEAFESQSNVYNGSQRCNGGHEVKETISYGMKADRGAD